MNVIQAKRLEEEKQKAAEKEAKIKAVDSPQRFCYILFSLVS
jgi:hypothetical protein